MPEFEKYERIVKPENEESLSKIATKIAKNSVVLDVGAGAGMLGRYLVSELNCIVDGIDIDAEAIENCKGIYRKVAIKNLESDELTSSFSDGIYDFIIVADVLEHLLNPDILLGELVKLAKPSGKIIFSVPNVSHIAVGLEILFGKFNYSKNGLLDNTHVRFYTQQSLLAKLEQFGMYPSEIDQVEKQIDETEFSVRIAREIPSAWLNDIVAKRPDALTYQWLVSTQLTPVGVSKIPKKLKFSHEVLPTRTYNSCVYFKHKTDEKFEEDKCEYGNILRKDDQNTVLDFTVPNSTEKIIAIRLDPVSELKPFLICKLEVFKNGMSCGKIKIQPGDFSEADFIAILENENFLFQAKTSDPHWIPKIESSLLDQLGPGCVLRLTLREDISLINYFNAHFLKNEQMHKRLQNTMTFLVGKVVSFVKRRFGSKNV